MRRATVFCALLSVAAVSTADAQSIAQRVNGTKNGTVRMSFAAKRGVCPGGVNGGGGYMYGGGYYGGYYHGAGEDGEEWTSGCKGQRVLVAMTLQSGKVTGVRTYVGGEWLPKPGVNDLGIVPAREAADYLMGLASEGPDGGRGAFYPAMLADSAVLWPRVLAIAEDRKKSASTRSWAISMLGSAPSDQALKTLAAIAEREGESKAVRLAAVGALASRPNNEGIPTLVNIAKSARDNEVRAHAVQSLANSGDPNIQEFLVELALKSR